MSEVFIEIASVLQKKVFDWLKANDTKFLIVCSEARPLDGYPWTVIPYESDETIQD